MATYIMLTHWTEQGIRDIKTLGARVDAFRQLVRNMGGEMKEIYALMGQYDIVAIVEAPNDEAMAKMVLSVGSVGNVKTETLRAFTEDEVKEIIAALP